MTERGNIISFDLTARKNVCLHFSNSLSAVISSYFLPLTSYLLPPPLPPLQGRGRPVDTSAAGRSADRAGRRDRWLSKAKPEGSRKARSALRIKRLPNQLAGVDLLSQGNPGLQPISQKPELVERTLNSIYCCAIRYICGSICLTARYVPCGTSFSGSTENRPLCSFDQIFPQGWKRQKKCAIILPCNRPAAAGNPDFEEEPT